MTDRNGKELKPGDKVMIVCEIKRIDDWPAGQWHPMSKGHSAVYLVANSNDGEPSHLYLHTPEMELVETPQGESKCQET